MMTLMPLRTPCSSSTGAVLNRVSVRDVVDDDRAPGPQGVAALGVGTLGHFALADHAGRPAGTASQQQAAAADACVEHLGEVAAERVAQVRGWSGALMLSRLVSRCATRLSWTSRAIWCSRVVDRVGEQVGKAHAAGRDPVGSHGGDDTSRAHHPARPHARRGSRRLEARWMERAVSTEPLVLVADDEARITKLVELALSDEGFRVDHGRGRPGGPAEGRGVPTRRGPPRHHDAGPRWHRGHARAARAAPGRGHPAERQGLDLGQGPRSGPGRGRLPGQALPS